MTENMKEFRQVESIIRRVLMITCAAVFIMVCVFSGFDSHKIARALIGISASGIVSYVGIVVPYFLIIRLEPQESEP